MTRHEQRENAFLAAFEESFGYNTPEEVLLNACERGPLEPDAEKRTYAVGEYGALLLEAYGDHLFEVDHLIEPRLTNWTMARIPRICLVAMRIALTEMLYMDEITHAVAIDEAVELVKKYGDENDYQFVNGVLGTISRDLAAGKGGEALNKDDITGITVDDVVLPGDTGAEADSPFAKDDMAAKP